jgi:methionine--tRNA ligase beta chain
MTAAARGWSMWEEIGIMPPNVLRCNFCDTTFGYLGVAPTICNKCGKPMRIPGTTFSDSPEPTTPAEVTLEDFQKIDLRVGRIVSAEPVPKSEKLLRLEVDFGDFKRQILAGVAKTFPMAVGLVGSQFVFVVNLAPRKMMGLESHGMLLAIGDDPASLSLIRPGQDVPNGSRAH